MQLFSSAEVVANELYRIIITDAWVTDKGGNIRLPNLQDQQHTMHSVLSGIQQVGGGLPSAVGRRHIMQGQATWISQGERTLKVGSGVCTDCAAAAAVRFLQITQGISDAVRVEIMSNTRHAFLVINRNACLPSIVKGWGNAIVLDIWNQNQYPRNQMKGVFWANDTDHCMAQTIRRTSAYLRVEVTFREPGLPK